MTDRAMRRHRWPALAAVFAVVLFALNAGATLDWQLLDLWFHLRPPRLPTSHLAVIAIDERSLTALGPFPWPRDTYVPLLAKLKGARVVGFDVFFGPNPHQQPQTQELATAIRGAGNVVCPLLFDHLGEASAPGAEPKEPFLRHSIPLPGSMGTRLLSAPELLPSEPEIASAAAALGHYNVRAAADGNIRKVAVVIEHGGRLYPFLGVQMLRVFLKRSLDEIRMTPGLILLADRAIPVEPSGELLFNWIGTTTTFPAYSFIDVVRGDVAPDAAWRGPYFNLVIVVVHSRRGGSRMRSVRLDAELEARLAEAVRLTGEPASTIMRKAIDEYCRKLVPARLDHRLADVIGTIESDGGRARRTGDAFRKVLGDRSRRRVPA